MVLQRAPAAAAVYGYLDSPSATVKVTVSSNGVPLYTVDATYNTTLQPFGDGWGVRPCPKEACPPYDMDTFTPYAVPLPTWKAMLQPTPAGGNYTISAVCTGCISNETLAIENVVFGDIWVRAANGGCLFLSSPHVGPWAPLHPRPAHTLTSPSQSLYARLHAPLAGVLRPE